MEVEGRRQANLAVKRQVAAQQQQEFNKRRYINQAINIANMCMLVCFVRLLEVLARLFKKELERSKVQIRTWGHKSVKQR